MSKNKSDEKIRVHFSSSPDGDWMGLYVNGKLLIEDHSLRNAEVLSLVLREIGIPAVISGGQMSPAECRNGQCRKTIER